MALFFNGDGKSVELEDLYKGSAAFLICGGPSLASVDFDLLRRPGVLTMGVNNSVKLFRPNLACTVDDPANFVRSLWFDPTILKFVRQYYTKPHYKENGENSSLVFDSDARQITDIEVKNCPATVFYKHNSNFSPEQFLTEETVCWGDVGVKAPVGGESFPDGEKGPNVRSVMLVALKILYRLGVRQVYLLGADFKMTATNSYAFDQGRDRINVNYNNRAYVVMAERFRQIKPYFEASGFEVFNATQGSMLKEFDSIPYMDAVDRVVKTNRLDFDLSRERTDGLYDRQARLKLEKQDRSCSVEPVVQSAQSASPASKVLIGQGAGIRKFARLNCDDEKWAATTPDQLAVGDRIRMWEPDGVTRVKSTDGASEWTVCAVKDDKLGLVHWQRETHLRNVNAGALEGALVAIMEAGADMMVTK